MRVPLTPEQLALNAAGAARIVALLDDAPPGAPRHELTTRERELSAGMARLDADMRARPHDIEQLVDRLRELALALRKPMPTLVEVLASKAPPAPKALPAAPTEEQHGDAAE